MTKNDALITVHAGSPAYGGLCLARWYGKVLLVRGAIPGESVTVRIERERRDYSLASVVDVIAPSAERVGPRCSLFGICGGCQLQYLSHSGQIRVKEAVLADCLWRVGGLQQDLSPALSADTPWHYRHRGLFKLSRGKVGFFREGTRDLVPVSHCPLMAEAVNDRLSTTAQFLEGLSLPLPFSGDLAELHVVSGDSVLALLKVSARGASAGPRKEMTELLLKCGYAGVVIAEADRILSNSGKQYCTLPLDGIRYSISPMSFFQSHWRLNQELAAFVRKSLTPLTGKRVLDLFSGAGNFSLTLAPHADEVIAVEENPCAVKDGERNLRINGIDNCRFVRSSAEAFEPEGPVHVLILDPPRSGLTHRVISNIMRMLPERIVYLSCNPATLARDLRKLTPGYLIESLRTVDFFPQTYHVESLAFLRRK